MVRPGYMQQQWRALVPMIDVGRRQAADRDDVRPRRLRPGAAGHGRAADPRQVGRAGAMNAAHRQLDHRVRFDWGPTGAAAIADGADVAVVVDVLSFTTTLCVAVERGMTVLPFRWKDERAAAYAEERDGHPRRRPARGAGAAGPRRRSACRRRRCRRCPASSGSSCRRRTARRSRSASPTPAPRWSVPACATGPPSPAGSLAPRRHDRGRRRRRALARRLAPPVRRGPLGRRCGAGAPAAATTCRPEARVAADAVPGRRGDVRRRRCTDCASGLELSAAGFAEDVAVAAELDVSDVVPVLADGAVPPIVATLTVAGCRWAARQAHRHRARRRIDSDA